ncbi:Detected protein of unknown function [Hibiscus syriacus]|uniref:Protein kinase domain-containing protein n=1 Tax=Hibiscus syriacus TaxID=106335 RepID=A0A6A3D4S7_HIBSY|nr:Detected protein of unknown function [Hibiscus syriacus]
MLTDLYLNMNNLSGQIPPEIADMGSLKVLQLCYNHLTGSIPTNLGSLKKLNVLALQSNKLTETANLRLPCKQTQCSNPSKSRKGPILGGLIVVTVALTAVGKNGSPLASLEYANGWDPLDGRNFNGFTQDVLKSFRFNLEEVETATIHFSEVERLLKAPGQCFLVYDFIPNGNLLLYLDLKDGDGMVLDWSTRVSIVKGIAKGIAYLHEYKVNKPALVHQNISAKNVLLDHRFNPKLSDSGLHNILTIDIVFGVHKASAAMGYLAPKYANTVRFTEKNDVYAFGVVVFQVLSVKQKIPAWCIWETNPVAGSKTLLTLTSTVGSFRTKRLN